MFLVLAYWRNGARSLVARFLSVRHLASRVLSCIQVYRIASRIL
jgi:hypothetical protein